MPKSIFALHGKFEQGKAFFKLYTEFDFLMIYGWLILPTYSTATSRRDHVSVCSTVFAMCIRPFDLGGISENMLDFGSASTMVSSGDNKTMNPSGKLKRLK